MLSSFLYLCISLSLTIFILRFHHWSISISRPWDSSCDYKCHLKEDLLHTRPSEILLSYGFLTTEYLTHLVLGCSLQSFFKQNFMLMLSLPICRIKTRASLVVQWMRLCLPMQGTQVWSLVPEDPSCRRAAKPVHHHYQSPCTSGRCSATRSPCSVKPGTTVKSSPARRN